MKLSEADVVHGATIRALAERRAIHDAAIAAGETVTEALRTSYRAVKSAVSYETFEKCAYCESKVNDVYVGDVEHMLPKGNDPARTLDYANLTFVCWCCNNSKRDTEPVDGLALLNPYIDEASQFFRFCGLIVRPVGRTPNNIRAKRTIDAVGLNRSGLLSRRQEQWERYELLEAAYYNAHHPAVRDSVVEQIRKMEGAASEDSMLASCFFRLAQI